MRGIIIPAVTPFGPDGAILVDRLQANIARWARSGVAGYMVLGTNGEARSLDDSESLDVIVAAAAANQGKTLIAGVGRESLVSTLRFIDQVAARQVRLDYVSVLTPSYFAKAMTDTALIGYYQAVADASPYPVWLYCAPAYANSVAISPAALTVLADHPNIGGIKDTSGSSMGDYLAAVGRRDDFTVLAGSITNLAACLAGGGAGGVCSVANYLPASCARIVELWDTDQAAALDLLAELRTLSAATSAAHGVAGVKACMNLLDYAGTVPRLPVLPVPARTAAGWADKLRTWRGLAWEPGA